MTSKTIHKALGVDITNVPKLIWTSGLSLDNEKIDTQHQNLFVLINKLIDNSDAECGSEIINDALYELLRYVEEHFHDEEELLKNINYPKFDEHKEAHRDFTKKVARFCQDVTEGKARITESIIIFLSGWVLEHTRTDDLDYKNYL